jgi:hypothetical protein
VDFTVTEWGAAANDAYNKQWEKSEFDWPEIFRRYRDPDTIKMAIWAGERLAGLALATVSSTAIKLQYLEGDSRKDCPLAGRRTLIVLDALANYGQSQGKTELRLERAKDGVLELYCDTYGFTLEKDPQGGTYLVRGI